MFASKHNLKPQALYAVIRKLTLWYLHELFSVMYVALHNSKTHFIKCCKYAGAYTCTFNVPSKPLTIFRFMNVEALVDIRIQADPKRPVAISYGNVLPVLVVLETLDARKVIQKKPVLFDKQTRNTDYPYASIYHIVADMYRYIFLPNLIAFTKKHRPNRMPQEYLDALVEHCILLHKAPYIPPLQITYEVFKPVYDKQTRCHESIEMDKAAYVFSIPM